MEFETRWESLEELPELGRWGYRGWVKGKPRGREGLEVTFGECPHLGQEEAADEQRRVRKA